MITKTSITASAILLISAWMMIMGDDARENVQVATSSVIAERTAMLNKL